MFVKPPFQRYTQNGALTPVAGGGGTWTEVYALAVTTPGQDAGNNGYTFVAVLPLAAFSGTGGTQIRLTFRGPTGAENCEMSAVYIGNGGGSNAYSFGAPPVRLQASGSNTITVGPEATVVTDAAAFVKDGTNTFVMALQLQNAAADNIGKEGSANPGGFSTWYKNAVEASTQAKSGYSDNSAASWNLLIRKIELLI